MLFIDLFLSFLHIHVNNISFMLWQTISLLFFIFMVILVLATATLCVDHGCVNRMCCIKKEKIVELPAPVVEGRMVTGNVY